MAQQTTNLHLTKPDLTDFADVRVLNSNFDILDEKVQEALDKNPDLSGLMPKSGGNFTGNITILNKQVLYVTESITDENNNYYYEMSDGSIICGGTFTELNQGGTSGGSNAIETYAKRINYLKPINKTLIGFTAMILPSDDSSFWGNSSASAMLRKPDTTGCYIEFRSSYSAMLLNTSKCMWRAYFK